MTKVAIKKPAQSNTAKAAADTTSAPSASSDAQPNAEAGGAGKVGPTDLEGRMSLALRALLREVAVTMGTGREAPNMCVQCVDKQPVASGGYIPVNRCGCQDARKALGEYDAAYSEA